MRRWFPAVLLAFSLFSIAWATIITSNEYGTEATPPRRHPHHSCLEMGVRKDHPIKAKPRLLQRAGTGGACSLRAYRRLLIALTM